MIYVMDTGIAMIHQDLNPILGMTVHENIFVGCELKKHGMVDTLINTFSNVLGHISEYNSKWKKHQRRSR